MLHSICHIIVQGLALVLKANCKKRACKHTSSTNASITLYFDRNNIGKCNLPLPQKIERTVTSLPTGCTMETKLMNM